jgi:hypothetical protein
MSTKRDEEESSKIHIRFLCYALFLKRKIQTGKANPKRILFVFPNTKGSGELFKGNNSK